jgi:hypothetical protein
LAVAALLREIIKNPSLSGSVPSHIGLLTAVTDLYRLNSTFLSLLSHSAPSATLFAQTLILSIGRRYSSFNLAFYFLNVFYML